MESAFMPPIPTVTEGSSPGWGGVASAQTQHRAWCHSWGLDHKHSPTAQSRGSAELILEATMRRVTVSSIGNVFLPLSYWFRKAASDHVFQKESVERSQCQKCPRHQHPEQMVDAQTMRNKCSLVLGSPGPTSTYPQPTYPQPQQIAPWLPQYPQREDIPMYPIPGLNGWYQRREMQSKVPSHQRAKIKS